MAAVRRSPLAALLLLVTAACLLRMEQSCTFIQAPEKAAMTSAAILAAGSSPLPAMAASQGYEQLASSVSVADLSPLENPSIIFVVLLSSFSMSIALVVWGRNGF
eukprot:TRINITY_DN442_c0_g1_i2.p1 TRINITY_DN442_c0_g1~~TRINITY_DN442_c0_g1_i2.p1  ORF type:complete len:105 (-),score=23.39 TRINITY_DN442_c0_g1_i2:175-489(-)